MKGPVWSHGGQCWGGVQYTSGVLAFLLHVPAIKRAELLPYHRFMGAATYWTGLSTMLVRRDSALHTHLLLCTQFAC